MKKSDVFCPYFYAITSRNSIHCKICRTMLANKKRINLDGQNEADLVKIRNYLEKLNICIENDNFEKSMEIAQNIIEYITNNTGCNNNEEILRALQTAAHVKINLYQCI
ncbi:MAG: hypothetical protein ACLFQV_02450 [Vulcanimicrobiota bacterium]